ncbi:sugar transferase [Roseateles oligotrophus]|uniref:sugar transferase n=1 Tax=Roseateles oligotrophus TaxID=1769250 RepID=UPI0029620125|nr:sugar transferase [Roseateles oligotrophus]
MLKRCFDICLAIVGLLLLAPLFVLIALSIKLDSPGPVFFRQQRVGRYGKLFDIYKFRTMTVAAPSAAGLQLTVAGDARITTVGAFLRRSKLDELAQLFDVLRGTMSFVGPRPEVPRYVEHYPPQWRDRLLSVRPGITDFASVRYRDESDLLAQTSDPEREYIETILPIKLQYALRYVDAPSLSTDLRVIGLTLRTVFVPNLSMPRSFDFMNNPKLWAWLDQAMSALRPSNRRVAVLVDALLILACWHITYLFRLGFERWQPGRPWYDDYVSFGVVVVYLLCMLFAGVPRSPWRFFAFDDFRRIVVASLAAGLISAVAILLAQLVGVWRAVLVLHPFFCIFALAGTRMVYRLVWEQARARTSGESYEPRRAIVLGAGYAARRLMTSLHGHDGWTVLALLDDDPAKQELRIAGVRVQGKLPDLCLPHILAGATHVILAMPGLGAEQREGLVLMARQTGLIVMTVSAQMGLSEETNDAAQQKFEDGSADQRGVKDLFRNS